MREKAIECLKRASEKAHQSEKRFYELTGELEDATYKLDIARSELIFSEKLNGRNEQQREAQLIKYARSEYSVVRKLKKEIAIAKIDYYSHKRDFEMWKSILDTYK